MRIGIPQAFIYYKYPGLWEDFFLALGEEVVLSGMTNRDILESGVRITESESCLPVKVYYGHCQWLLTQKIDVLFSPRYISLKKERLGCPKFFALADVIPYMFPATMKKIPSPACLRGAEAPLRQRQALAGVDTGASAHGGSAWGGEAPYGNLKICAPYINLNEKDLPATMRGVAQKLGCPESKIEPAVAATLNGEKKRRDEKRRQFEKTIKARQPIVLVISHPYNLHDRFVNADLVVLLQRLGVVPLMIDAVPIERHHRQDFFFHWDFAEEMLDQIDEVMDQGIAGGLQVSTFNCGCDSVIKEFVEKKFRQAKRPYMPLILDEHTAEAGIKTRLEAFVDTLKSEKRSNPND